ncbi:MAG: Ig-like domain-containing protein [Mobilitalea sp.]
MLRNITKRKRQICLVITLCLLISTSPTTAKGNTLIGSHLKSMLSPRHTEQITNNEPAELPLRIPRPESLSPVSSLSIHSTPGTISSFSSEYITISRPDDGYSCLFAYGSYQFTATVHGTGLVDQTVTWSVSSSSGSSATMDDSSGLLSVGSTVDTLTITATSALYGVSASYVVYAYSESSFGGACPTPAAPQGISLTANTVLENQPAGSVIGKLYESNHAIDNPAYRYTLVTSDNNASTVDDDLLSSGNSSFVIEGNILKTNAVYDYNTNQSYRILVKCETYYSNIDYNTIFKTFTIDIQEDNIAPTATLILPFGSAVSLSSNGITISFSETVTAISNGTVIISNGSSDYIYTISTDYNYVSGTGMNCRTIIPFERFINGATLLSLTPNTTYTVSISSGAYQDVEGLSISDSLGIGSFTTVKSSEKEMVSFALDSYIGTIAANQTVSVSVPHGTDISALTSIITVSNQATVSPASGTTLNFLISNPLPIVVTADDGTTKTYAVSLTVEPPVTIPVSSITVSGNNTVVLGGTLQFIASVLPANATDSSILWGITSGSAYASISPEGLLTSTGAGSVTVTATAKDASGVYGTETINIYQPSPVITSAPVVTSIPIVTSIPVATPTSLPMVIKPVFNIELSAMDFDASGNLLVPISSKELMATLSDSTIDNIAITLLMSNKIIDLVGKSSNLMLSADVLSVIKESGKGLTITLRSESNSQGNTWSFSADQLSSSNEVMTAINLIIKSYSLTDKLENSKSLSNYLKGNGLILSFSQDRLLPSQASVKYYIGDQKGFTPGKRIYLYHYNQTTDKLETLPYSSAYKVNEAGFININIAQGSDYVMLLEPAALEDLTTLREQISVTPAKKTLSMGSNTKRTTQILIDLPVTLYHQSDTSGAASRSALGAATVTYSSDNANVIKVDQNGKVTAVGSGKATITTKITLYSGKVKNVKTIITVTE